jgi:hypothetical protein
MWTPPKFGLIQEKYWPDGWKILVCCLCLNLTKRAQMEPVVEEMFRRWPNPSALASASDTDLEDLVRSLGMQRKRTQTLKRMFKHWWLYGAPLAIVWQNGAASVPPAPPVVADRSGRGNIDWLKAKKKKGKVLKYSDFENRDAYQKAFAEAMAAASMPIAKVEPTIEQYEEVFGDDDEILKALFLITTIH